MNKPNFIVFLTDDQGYGDLSCMGATDFKTPHLDRMADSGVRFTNWYSNSPVCSPSRAALLTGRYPGNAGVRSILAGHRTATGLPTEVPTLADALKELGYYTAMSGKWHLGLAEGSRPHDHGFHDWFGFMAGCIDYYSHIFYWQMNRDGRAQFHDLWENGVEFHRDGEYFTELITEYAVKYIRRSIQLGKPFFLYIPYNAPHYPMHAPEKYVNRFPDLSWDRQIMAAMISAIDDSVGEILSELERQGLLENTFTYFQSDNGPSREARNWMDGNRDPYYGGSAGKLKGHKGSLYEGGIRVPFIARWPGHVPAKKVSHHISAFQDVFPTLLELAGIENKHRTDGISMAPTLLGRQGQRKHDYLYWEFRERGGRVAVLKGDWKGIRLNSQKKPDGPLEIYHLEKDIGEETNLASRQKKLTEEFEAVMKREHVEPKHN